MIRISDKSRCCGCTACMSVCPHGALSMKPDVLGFMYPEVNPARCTDCGLCDKVCDFCGRHEDNRIEEDRPLEVYAASNRDSDVLLSSQSGGVFTAVSDVVLSQGGVVYGAVMNDDFTVSHARADNAEERDRMRGSKYVQSMLDGIFRSVLEDLVSGRTVLFTGTPCQVAGLASFIPSRFHEKLILMDFICHGVPSPSVWKDYVSEMRKKGVLEKVCFRDKSCGGWKVHKETFRYADGRLIERETYRVLFYKNIMLRDSCGVCPYSLGNRRADITIGDFWGLGEMHPEYDDPRGTSILICSSGKGKMLVEAAEKDLCMRRVVTEAGFLRKKNPNLFGPSRIYKDRKRFEEAYGRKGFLYVARRWGDMGWRYKAWQLKVFFKKMFGRL